MQASSFEFTGRGGDEDAALLRLGCIAQGFLEKFYAAINEALFSRGLYLLSSPGLTR